MKKLNTRMIGAIALVAGLGAFGSANATATWTFAGTSGGDATTGLYTSVTDGNLTISGAFAANRLSALATSGVGAGVVSATLDSGFLAGAKWTVNGSSTLKYYGSSPTGGSLAMFSDGIDQPNHAIDNAGTNTEAVILKFSNSVVLTSIGIGYFNTDADISLWRYTKAGTAPVAGQGATKSEMMSAGWELVGNKDLQSDGTVNSGGLGSSWWMISAYNSSYGGSGFDQGNDFFKLSAITGNKCVGDRAKCGNIPEPSSIALLGLGLLGIFGARQRKQSVASA